MQAPFILESQAASLQQLEQAMIQQMRHGGDLISHLLDLGVSEARLLEALAKSHGAPALPEGELPRASETALQLVTPELAWRFRLYPLAFQGGTLTVALSEPLPAAIERELSQLLGIPLDYRFATLQRIRQAVARDYEIPLSPRLLSLLGEAESPRTPTFRGLGFDAEPSPESTKSLQEIPRSESRTLASFVEKAAQARPSRRLGPVTIALAKEALENAKSRDEVLSAFLDFARQFFEYSALFIVQRQSAQGWDSHGRGPDSERVQAIEIPLDRPGSLAASRDRKVPTITSLQREGTDRALFEGLDRQTAQPVLLLPLVVRDRTVAILYGDHGDAPVELSAVGDVLALAPFVGTSLERLILKKKRG